MSKMVIDAAKPAKISDLTLDTIFKAHTHPYLLRKQKGHFSLKHNAKSANTLRAA
jgi:hypothetical protein